MTMILGIIYGGTSTERNISIDTAYTFMQWIDFSKYSILPIYINEHRQWNIGNVQARPLDKEELEFNSNEKNINKLKTKIDVAIPLLNGIGGEDGSVQGLLETLDIPYAGSGIEASAIGMNKILTKRLLKSLNIPMVKDVSINKFEWLKEKINIINKLHNKLQYPLIVKPARLGSSIGIIKVNHKDEIDRAIEEAFIYDQDVIIEEFIKCREILVSVLQNKESIYISIPGEVVTTSEFYTYEDKYSKDSTADKRVAKLSRENSRKIELYSRNIFEKLNARGLLRIDFFLNEQNIILVNEVNTVPSLGGTSVYPYLLKQSNINEQEIVDSLVSTALYYDEVKKTLIYKY